MLASLTRAEHKVLVLIQLLPTFVGNVLVPSRREARIYNYD
jgi:hypothetical protein